jgi:hypothetical protein
MQVFILDKALGHKLDQNWPHIKKKLSDKILPNFELESIFLTLCLKTKEKIQVKSPKGYILRNVFHL